MRTLPLYTLKRPWRRNPISVIPQRPAVLTAMLEGAPTAASTGMAGDQSLLYELVTRASADHHHRIAQRRATAQQGVTDQLVHRVVPSDVFAQRVELAPRIEERGGVQSAGGFKNVLSAAKFMRQAMNHTGIDSEMPRRKDRTSVCFECCKGRLSAEPAGRRHHEAALRLRRLNRHFGR